MLNTCLRFPLFWLLIICALVQTPPLLAQREISKEQFKKIKLANAYLKIEDYQNALPIFKELYEKDTSDHDLAYKVAFSMYHLKKYRLESIFYFEKSLPNEIPETHYYLGRMYHLHQRFEEALIALQEYESSPKTKKINPAILKRDIQNVKNAKEMLLKRSDIKIQNIGEDINTSYPEYVPLISADESILIFTSRRANSTGNLKDPNDEYFEDIFLSQKNNEQWTIPRSISTNINTDGHDACVALSASGERLIVYKTSNDLRSGDLYESVYNGKEWSVPEKMGSDINTSKWRELSASISVDENSFYFSSDRPGGFGGLDIYRVVKLPNGKWSKASNLGPMINTPFDEDSPFIHPDQKTLYFSSKGHKNMGGYDIFKSKMDDFGLWTEPENLGSPINTVDDDIYFVLSTDGKRGYYSSSHADSYGSTDVYLINNPDRYENFELSLVKGIVINSESSSEPVYATITILDDANLEVTGLYQTNKYTGKFLMVLERERIYKMLIEADGYYPYTSFIYSHDQTSYEREMDKPIKLVRKSKMVRN